MSDIVGTLTIASTDISGTLTTDETTISVTLNTGGASVVGTVSLVGATGPQGIQGADGLGVPSGGTTAQVLAKASNTDNDTEWINNTGGGGGGGDALVANPLSQFAATTKAQLNGVISDGTPLYVGDAPTSHTHVVADVTDFDTEVANNSAVAANTAKVTNVAHPLVETAVPSGAVFTDTVYDDTAIQAEVDANTAKVSYTDAAAVAANTAKTGITAQQAADITANNAKVTYDDAAAVAANTAKVTFTDAPSNGSEYVRKDAAWAVATGGGGGVSDHTLLTNIGTKTHATLDSEVDANNAKISYTDAAAVAANTAKVGVTTELKPTDIDTLAEINAIITDATLIDTADARLSDARTPTAHTHTASEITDFDAEVANNSAVAANTAKVSNVSHPLVETAVPVGAVFTDTDTVYDDTAIQAEVDANTAKTGITAQQASDIVTNNAKVTYDDAAAVAANTAKVGVTTELKPTDIDTLAELNAIVTDATLIDTGDARLSNARTPTAHTHVIDDITDITGTPDGTKFLRDDGVWTAIAGGGDALVANPLSQFAGTTKAQLNGVISDGTPMYVGDAPTSHTHVVADVTDFDAEVASNSAVAANTAKTGVTTEEANPDLISQAEAEAGTATTERTFSALRVAQAITALGGGGGGGTSDESKYILTADIVSDNNLTFATSSDLDAVVPAGKLVYLLYAFTHTANASDDSRFQLNASAEVSNFYWSSAVSGMANTARPSGQSITMAGGGTTTARTGMVVAYAQGGVSDGTVTVGFVKANDGTADDSKLKKNSFCIAKVIGDAS